MSETQGVALGWLVTGPLALKANPESAQATRDVSVSHFKFFHFHRQRGDEEAAIESLAKCFSILDSFARSGRPMDAQMRGLYSQLQPLFTKR
jgi:hypothetical protein